MQDIRIEKESMVFAPLTEEERTELQRKVEWFKEFTAKRGDNHEQRKRDHRAPTTLP